MSKDNCGCLECALRAAIFEFFGDPTGFAHGGDVILACASIIGSIAGDAEDMKPKLHELLDHELNLWRDIYASGHGRQH